MTDKIKEIVAFSCVILLNQNPDFSQVIGPEIISFLTITGGEKLQKIPLKCHSYIPIFPGIFSEHGICGFLS
jgi:hypothetical protein